MDKQVGMQEESVQEVVEKKQKQRTVFKRVSGLLLVIFLITYFYPTKKQYNLNFFPISLHPLHFHHLLKLPIS